MPDPSEFGPHLLGRDTESTVRHWDAVSALLPPAPAIMLGPRPRRSPGNHRYLDYRYAGQLIGDCVGESGAHVAEFLGRAPASRLPGAPPLKGVSVSPLHVYYHGRAECFRRGIRLGRDGCVVSVAAAAAQSTGFCRWDLYPATDAAYRSYSDSSPPPAVAEAEGKVHRLLSMAQLRSFGGILDYLSQGYVVWVGKPVREGILRTEDSGYYRCDVGEEIGGHATVLVDYDEDLGAVLEFNSWSNVGWGMRLPAPNRLDPRCRGCTNLGWTDLDAMAAVFSDAAFARGEVEAVAVTAEEQFAMLSSPSVAGLAAIPDPGDPGAWLQGHAGDPMAAELA